MPISRNAPCPCGSGKKYKKCCMLKAATGSATTAASSFFDPEPAQPETSPHNYRTTEPPKQHDRHEPEPPPADRDDADTAATPNTEIVRLLDKSSAIEAINRLDMEDLRFLNRLIVDRLNFLVTGKRNAAMGKFYPGVRVRFTSTAGERKCGTVIRVNQKTVSVAVDGDPGWWKVSPGLLEHA